MPSYNSVSGEPVIRLGPRLLTTLLREQMGFDGIAGRRTTAPWATCTPSSAWPTALRPRRPGRRCAPGIDVELHVPQGVRRATSPDWFAHGRADIALLDRAVHQVLTAKFRMGLFESPFALGSRLSGTRPSGHRRDAVRRPAARHASRSSSCATTARCRCDRTCGLIAVIGCHAASARFFFGGYTHFSMAEGKFAANAVDGRPDDQRRRHAHRSTTPSRAPASRRTTTVRRSRSCCSASSQASATCLARAAPIGCPTPRWCWARRLPVRRRRRLRAPRGPRASPPDADVVLLTLGGKHGTASIASMGEGIDATDINLPRLPGGAHRQAGPTSASR